MKLVIVVTDEKHSVSDKVAATLALENSKVQLTGSIAVVSGDSIDYALQHCGAPKSAIWAIYVSPFAPSYEAAIEETMALGNIDRAQKPRPGQPLLAVVMEN